MFEVQYGHGTWIDASGSRTAVPARFDKDRIVLIAPDTMVNTSVFPAVLDPKIVVGPLP